MRVWLTRTEPGNSRQAGVLSDLGFAVVAAPVLDIEPLHTAVPPGRFDAAVFVSEHAASNAVANGWRDGGAIAIGTAAENALRNLGISPAWPTRANAQGVVDAWAGRAPSRTLLVKGVGGSDTIQRWLLAEGRDCVEWNVYRRVHLAPTVDADRIDAIVVGSGDGLRVVGQLWFARQGDADVPVLVPSERVAALALSLGFSNAVVTSGAGVQAVAAALGKLKHGSGHG